MNQIKHSERVLGHVGVEEIYDQYRYLDEKSEALRALAALIEQIVYPPADNAIPLREGELPAAQSNAGFRLISVATDHPRTRETKNDQH